MAKLCNHKYFSFAITSCIVINTILLSLDSYPARDDLSEILDIINIAFSVIFLFEMAIKVVGLGFKPYLKDRFNCFDAIIVILSMIDIALNFSLANSGFITRI